MEPHQVKFGCSLPAYQPTSLPGRIFRHALSLVIITMSFQLVAQNPTDYITYTERSSRGFTGVQITKLNRIISNPLYEAHYYVDLQELPAFSTDGTVTVNLPRISTGFIDLASNDIDGDGVLNLSDVDPFDPCEPASNNANCTSLLPTEQVLYEFVPLKIETLSPTEYTYYGEFDPCGEESGYISIISKDGNLFGQININDEVYEIFDLGNRKNILVKWDNSAFPSQECADGDTERSFELDPNLGTGGERGCNRNVRVLVLYTQRADDIADPWQRGILAIQQSNAIARNSGAMVSFTLAGVTSLFGFEEEVGAIRETHDNFGDIFNGIPTILRNEYQADLVALLVNTDDPNFAGISELNDWGDVDHGFFTAEIDAANGRYTFSHEMAHDFGCKHNDDERGAPDFVFASRGHNFIAKNDTRRTVMNQLFVGQGDRIMHWSNPDVRFKRRPTGTADRNNGAQMTNLACLVASYRTFNSPITVDINGPASGLPGQTLTYCAVIQNCTEVLNIQWEYSFNGFHYFPVQNGNGTCITLTMPPHGSIYIKVKVFCKGGESETAFQATHNEIEDPRFNGCDSLDQMEMVLNIHNDPTNLIVAPNPTEGNIKLTFDVREKSRVSVKFYNSAGKMLEKLMNGEYEIGRHSIYCNLSDIPAGQYLVHLKIGHQTISKQFFKI